ncbi:MAG: thioredoxin domain-containing protein [Sphingobacteriales bacterium]|nr:MAG: thioredoxin domain-containing protein [Sphingobacteriales bacterium]
MANRLIDEQSPYLLQHAHNPVNWYPWGEEAFIRAQQEQKPVLVSIGYAACHWCHVMEHESFEDEATAAYMNEHFINIKVDREERPDVDHLYMDAVQAIGGSGGWPLNVFVTPGRAPFYGGTYFPPRQAYGRPSWMQLLERIHHLWTEQRDEVNGQSEQLLKHLQQASLQAAKADDTALNENTCAHMCKSLLQMADKKLGGFGNAPKFPGTMAINFLLEHYHFTQNEDALKHALRSLDAMLEGGIYDQLAGGFCRYATDANWLIPHFEKMLYDNALLIGSLCDAYSITKNEQYKRIAEETISFVNKELKDASGLYYSALDADSEGVEGKFYTWAWSEWEKHSGDKENIAALYFGVSDEGNWEETNILHVANSLEAVAKEKNVTIEQVQAHIAQVKQNLLQHRATRIRPLTDDKSLLSWNALMNIALIKAGVVFGKDEYIRAADGHMQVMLQSFYVNGNLNHVWKNGEAKVMANIDDYAYLVQALVQLGSATGNEYWLLQANELSDITLRDFLHEDGNYFYFSSQAQKDIPVRKVDKYDGAQPSANAVMASNLYLLGICMEHPQYIEQGIAMWQQMASAAMRYTYSFAQWAIWQQRYVYGIKTVVIASEDGETIQKNWNQHFIPNAYVLTSKKEISEIPLLKHKFLQSQTHIFVCTESACMHPVADLKHVLDFFLTKTL